MKTMKQRYKELKADPEKYRQFLDSKIAWRKKQKKRDPDYNKKWNAYMKAYREKRKEK